MKGRMHATTICCFGLKWLASNSLYFLLVSLWQRYSTSHLVDPSIEGMPQAWLAGQIQPGIRLTHNKLPHFFSTALLKLISDIGRLSGAYTRCMTLPWYMELQGVHEVKSSLLASAAEAVALKKVKRQW